jgi:hypothetical protein
VELLLKLVVTQVLLNRLNYIQADDGCRGVIGAECSVVGQERPHDPGILVRQCGRRYVLVALGHQLPQPAIRLCLVLGKSNHGSRSVDQQCSEVGIVIVIVFITDINLLWASYWMPIFLSTRNQSRQGTGDFRITRVAFNESSTNHEPACIAIFNRTDRWAC